MKNSSISADQVRLLARALWGDAWQLEALTGAGAATARPVLSQGSAGVPVLHLPPALPDALAHLWSLAVASHAAAHLRFGAGPQVKAGLKPIQQALFGVLEDARVEWLALQDLPGLRAVWWPFHACQASLAGAGFEALLGRLSACLLDPAHVDPHPWLARVKAIFFAPDGHTLALPTVAAVRQAASVLGHDVGQMRLPFNAKIYQVHARYRDDNTHLWLSDELATASDTVLTQSLDSAAADAAPPQSGLASGQAQPEDPKLTASEPPTAQYPEWDHRIARYRRLWCSVYASVLPALSSPSAATVSASDGAVRRLSRHLATLRGRMVHTGGCATTGDEPHAAALVEAQIAKRAGRSPDLRLYRRQARPRHPLAVLLLLDASASTAASAGGTAPALAQLQNAALASSLALQKLGHRTALWAFSSQGRHRIDMPCLKDWHDSARHAQPSLHSSGSTRMGAALRHALHVCQKDAKAHLVWHRVIVLLTDGELHDVDVHDSTYLGADLHRAAMEATAQGVAVRALVLRSGTTTNLDQALGLTHTHLIQRPSDIPQALVRVLAGC